ncbi:MAG: hypothetical protein K6A30_03405 [Lachnospiraceae bacterium]|nr:hypothetical protein [Lachnospiraceae bacterium]
MKSISHPGLMKFFEIIILSIGTAFFNAMVIKADIGVFAAWESLSIPISHLTGLQVFTFSMIMNTVCILIQMLILRKDFPKTGFLQFIFVLGYGSLVNFFYYNFFTFTIHHYYQRLFLLFASIVGVGFFLGSLCSLKIVSMSLETTCVVLSEKLHISFSYFRIGIDVVCVVVSVLLSWLFHLPLAIREGTIICVCFLGLLENFFMKRAGKFHEKLYGAEAKSAQKEVSVSR